MSHDLTDLVVLITGSGRGLGRGGRPAPRLLRRGYRRRRHQGPSAQQTAAEIKAAGGRAFAYQADLAGEKAFREVAAEFAGAAGGRIDAVVNNASVLRYEPFEEVTEHNVDLMIGAGLKSTIWGCQALIRHMDPARGGSIVNYASPVAVRGYPRAGRLQRDQGRRRRPDPVAGRRVRPARRPRQRHGARVGADPRHRRPGGRNRIRPAPGHHPPAGGSARRTTTTPPWPSC